MAEPVNVTLDIASYGISPAEFVNWLRGGLGGEFEKVADDIEAQIKPTVPEPELDFSVINARPAYTDTVTTLTKLGGRWLDIDGNDVGKYNSLSEVEVLRVGIGDDPRPAQDDAFLCGREDYKQALRKRYIQLASSEITAERKDVWRIALDALEAL